MQYSTLHKGLQWGRGTNFLHHNYCHHIGNVLALTPSCAMDTFAPICIYPHRSLHTLPNFTKMAHNWYLSLCFCSLYLCVCVSCIEVKSSILHLLTFNHATLENPVTEYKMICGKKAVGLNWKEIVRVYAQNVHYFNIASCWMMACGVLEEVENCMQSHWVKVSEEMKLKVKEIFGHISASSLCSN